jgi:hypothetical protein
MTALALLATAFATVSAYSPATTVTFGTDYCGHMMSYVCQGLYSRNPSTAAYLLVDGTDSTWLNFTGGSKGVVVSETEFTKQCLVDFPRYIRYNYTSQQELVPNIATLAGVLDAVPMQDGCLLGVSPPQGATMVFDALAIFEGFKEIQATAYVFDHYGHLTTGLAKLNPGWHWDKDVEHQLDPQLIGRPDLRLVDLVVKERLFNFFLKNGCVKETEEHKLLERMLADKSNNSANWPRPIVVYGYDDSHPLFGGDVFEAETTCSNEHNMGQVASHSRTPNTH